MCLLLGSDGLFVSVSSAAPAAHTGGGGGRCGRRMGQRVTSGVPAKAPAAVAAARARASQATPAGDQAPGQDFTLF